MSLVDHLREKFHIITPVSNPVRYSSRYRLYREFEQRMKAANVQLHTIELQNGERKFAVTEHGNPYHIQVRTDDELWSKENLINIAVRNLTEHWPDWKYVAWVDADVEFTRPDWVHETINEL